MAGGTNPIGPYSDVGKTLKNNQPQERRLGWRRRTPGKLLFTRTFEGKNNRPNVPFGSWTSLEAAKRGGQVKKLERVRIMETGGKGIHRLIR
jgi:hypothetical protein